MPPAQLATQLSDARRAYYAGESIMSDEAYDDLEAQLKAQDPANPLLKTVGAPVANTLTKVTHAARMGSLDNAFSEDDIRTWFDRVHKLSLETGIAPPTMFVAQPKLDGLSVSLTYRDGVLVRAATRGDGNEGEDVTANMFRAQQVPHTLPFAVSIEVRGEVLLHKDEWAANFVGDANPRNSAAGTTRRSDGAKANWLRFYAFKVEPPANGWAEDVLTTAGIPDGKGISTERRALNLASILGFTPARCDAIKNVDTMIAAWETMRSGRNDLPYEIDGWVVKVDNIAKAEGLGWSDTCPRGAIACKWKGGMVAETEVIGIVNSVGHIGAITPVMIVKPVHCGGVSIERVSLMNWDEVGRIEGASILATGLSSKTLGVGARVKIERSGDVIPRCLAVLEACPTGHHFTRPEECPSCGAEAFHEGPRQMCKNPVCPAQTARKVTNWVKGRGILHLGDSTVDKLMAINGPVATIADLYRLDRDKLKDACGGYVMSDKVLAQLEKSRDCTAAQVLGNIGIGGVGESESDKVCMALGITTCLGLLSLSDAPTMTGIAGIGPSRAQAIAKGVATYRTLIEDLDTLLRVAAPTVAAPTAGSVVAGKTFCITGATNLSRAGLIKVMTDAGAIWKGSVVKGLDILIVADPSSGSTKLREASAKGVQLVAEVDALKWAGYGAK